jgi:alpha-tubulin suppressor-like RCC1 family protein/putative cell wall-binding protein
MNKILGIVLVTILVLCGTVVPVSAETFNETNTTSRLAGQDHYQTSVAIAGAYNNNGDCDNVILASGNSFPDALSASLLSKKWNAPILLVNSTVIDSSNAFNYIGSHLSNTGTVYIIGGTGVIGSAFETKLTSMGYSNIKRLGGTDRYNTDMLIANDVNVPQGTPVFIASGENFPDALSIASFSGSKQYPILLVGTNYLPDKTRNFITNDYPSTVYIAGGTGVVSQNIKNQIKALVPDGTVTRLAGDDRFGTNAAVLNEFSPDPGTIYIANGDDFQDVLSGSALAAKTGDPIILEDNQLSTLPSAIEAYLKTLNSSGGRPNVIILGGTDVVSDELMQQVNNVFSDVTNTSTSQGATDTDNSTLIEKQKKAGPSRIALGYDTAYYLDSSGHVWAWGGGDHGQLGNGMTGTQLNHSTDPIHSSNVPVEVLNLSNIVSIATGGNNCYALDSNGHVWAWGDGSSGELGNGTKGTQLNLGQYPIYGSTVPVQVLNLTDIVSIAASQITGYALDSSGHVWAWGGGQFGIPDGSYTSDIPTQVSPLTDIVSISADAQGNEAFAFDSADHVWAWGYFGSGSGTMPITVNQPYVPIQLSNLKNIAAIAYGGVGDKNDIYDSTGKYAATPSNDQIWYALDSSGQVLAWEFIGSKAGDGIAATPVKVPNLSNIVAIAGRGTDLTAVIKESGYVLDKSGHVWAWGDGSSGELGNGTSTKNQTTPVQISNISNIVAITGGMLNGYALDNSGHVWTWGFNYSGQLGNGTITSSSIPVQVLGLPK